MQQHTRLIVRALWISGLLALLYGTALAQSSGEPRRSVRASAEASVVAPPDQALLDIGVVTQAPAAKDAGAQNARKLDRVMQALRRTLGSGADIHTLSFAVTPNYTYPREGGQPRLTGYTASNTVRVKTGDLEKVGQVIDAATQAGANNVTNLRFALKDEAPVRAKALQEATVKARSEAEAIAGALGVRIVGILSAEESGPIAIPMYGAAEMRTAAADVTTPIEPGPIDMHASVTVTFEVSK